MSLVERHPVSWSVALLLTAALPAAEAPAQSVVLKPKYTAGHTGYLELDEQVTQTLRGGMFGPDGRKFDFRHLRGLAQKVEASSPGEGAKLAMTFDRIQLQSSFAGMGQSNSFDSDVDDPKDESNPLANAVGGMLGMTMRMEVDADGNVKSFSGMKEILAKMEEAAAGNPMFEQMVRRELRDDSARVEWGEKMMALFPNKEVKVGETWTRTLREPTQNVGELIWEYHCKLERLGVENGRQVAVVACDGTIRRASEEPAEAGPMGMKLEKLTGRFTGGGTFDVDRGEFVKQNQTTEMNIVMAGPGAAETQPADPEAGKMKVDLASTRTVSVLSPAEREKQKGENRRKAEEKKAQEKAEDEAPEEDED